MHFQWSTQLAQEFNDALSNLDLESLIARLNILSNDVTQCGIDNLCQYLNEILLSTAKNVGVYRENTVKTRKIKLKPQCPPWFDHECREKRRLYYRTKKNNLRREGAKTMSNEKAKEFKKFVKFEEKSYYKQLNNKIKTLRSSNSKEYWSLNKSTEGRKSHSKICLQTFMEHFKKLNHSENSQTPEEQSFISNHNQPEMNEELNVDFAGFEIKRVILKLKNSKACGIDLIRNELLIDVSPAILDFICIFST